LVPDGSPYGPTAVTIAPNAARVAYSENQPGKLGLSLLDLDSGTHEFIPDAAFGAQFAPDSLAIAYTTADQTGGRIVVRDLTEGTERTLYEGDIQHIYLPVAWTPQGLYLERIILNSDAPPQGLFVVDPAGGEPQVVREEDFVEVAISVDGRKAAFVTGFLGVGAPGRAGIALRDLGTGQEQVAVEERPGMIRFVRWSPDATQLLYSAAEDYGAAVRAFHLVDAASLEGRTVALDDLGLSGALHDAAWRDSATLLLLIADAGGELRLYEVPSSTSSPGVANLLGSFGSLSQGQSAQILAGR
jgi:Tol biopolymer transport system component